MSFHGSKSSMEVSLESTVGATSTSVWRKRAMTLLHEAVSVVVNMR